MNARQLFDYLFSHSEVTRPQFSEEYVLRGLIYIVKMRKLVRIYVSNLFFHIRFSSFRGGKIKIQYTRAHIHAFRLSFAPVQRNICLSGGRSYDL